MIFCTSTPLTYYLRNIAYSYSQLRTRYYYQKQRTTAENTMSDSGKAKAEANKAIEKTEQGLISYATAWGGTSSTSSPIVASDSPRIVASPGSPSYFHNSSLLPAVQATSAPLRACPAFQLLP